MERIACGLLEWPLNKCLFIVCGQVLIRDFTGG
jgi:hypothetical protein